jgi:tetratricopeptide (TPR) repeat protein
MINRILLILFFSFSLLFSQTNLNNKYRLGKTYEQSGQLEKAKEIFEELTKIQPSNNQYSNSLNDVYLKLKEYEKSISFLTERIKLRTNDVSLYGMLGATYYISGNSQKAIEVWEKGISTNNYSQINYTIIVNFASQNRAFEIAVKFLREGKSKSKNPIQFSYQIAQIHSYTMNYGDAAEEYCSALIQQPTQLDYVKRRMGTYLSAFGALEQSIDVLKRYDESNSIKELLSFLYVKNNQFAEAFELAKELDKTKGDEGVLIYNFASETYRNSEFNIASLAFKYMIDEYPNSKFIPNSKIGYAKTLESKLNIEWSENQENWKPIFVVDTSNSYKYKPIIKTYESLTLSTTGLLANEALFRIGNIYAAKFSDYTQAAKYFNKTIKNSSLSDYYGKANLELAKISLQLNDLDKAKRELINVFNSSQTEKSVKEEAKFLMAQIDFCQSKFEGALSTLSNINKDLSSDFSNDAIQLAMLINIGKNDSLNLVKFGNAELAALQLKLSEAEKEFKELSENKNLFFINNISRLKYAQILIAQNNYPVAIEILKELSETKELNIFADRSFYLLAQVYAFGIVDEESAMFTLEKFLELYPNSLYLEKAQKDLKQLKNKISEKI